jgi:hypothetical protein
MSKTPTRDEVRAVAQRVVQFYSATLRLPDKASVHKGTKDSIDPSLEPASGWWVDCQIFVEDGAAGEA